MTAVLHNWAFGIIPEDCSQNAPKDVAHIIALFGDVHSDNTRRFLPGSGRIVSFDPKTLVAISESGSQYTLSDVDPDFNEMYQGKAVQAFAEAVSRNA